MTLDVINFQRKSLFKVLFILFFVIISILGLNKVFAFSIYDSSGNFVYYINDSKPTVLINISAGTEGLYVEKAVLSCDSNNYDYNVPIQNRSLSIFTERKYKFGITQDLSQCQKIHFKLFVYDSNKNHLIKPQGDPVDFDIVFDDTLPILQSYQNQIAASNKLILKFSENIYDLNITLNNQVLTYSNIFNNKLKQGSTVTLDVSSLSFPNELNNVVINFRDLAGNEGSKSEVLYVKKKDLKISLLTLQNDSQIKYNYDPKYPNFFNSTIYTKKKNFELYVKTNKPAKCYFTSSLLNFKTFSNVVGKTQFSSSDNITHTVAVSQYDTKIWVACVNLYNSNEIVYLSKALGIGNNLINVKFYNKGNLQITYLEPSGIVTNNPFAIFAKTNNKAICEYNLDGQSFQLLGHNLDYLSFNKSSVTASSGQHTLNLKCFDLVNNEAQSSQNININTNLGVKVTDYSPKYIGKQSQNISIVLSEYQGINCKYYDQVKSISEFNNFNAISGTGLNRYFLVSNLHQGNNSFFIYCNKSNQITMSKISLIYDSKGVSISNCSFINGNFKSAYVGKKDEIVLGYKINSLIPIKKVYASVSAKNKSDLNFSFGNLQKITMIGDFTNYSNIFLRATNLIGVNGTVNVPLKFDFQAPTITLVDNGNLKGIICKDLKSGCAKVSYGLSMIGIDCQANKLYNKTPIDTQSKNYLCVEAFDYANNKYYHLYPLHNFSSSIGGSGISNLNKTEVNSSVLNESFNDNETNISSDNSSESKFKPLQDISVKTKTSSFPFKTVVALFMILLVTGSGSYYAYKKGYLDEQLKKLGIVVPNKKNSRQSLNSKGFSGKNNFQNKDWTAKDSSFKSKSNYEKHLNKVNRFIESKIRQSENLFSQFETSNKGKVKKYPDTLAKKEINFSKTSKEDFDEFYSSSKSKSLPETKDVEKEAESFETYLKKKEKKDVVSKKSRQHSKK